MKYIIVESPTKARTISNILGKGYLVLSSNGHVRDLPKSDLGIDVDHDFTPHYIIPRAARKKVSQLKKQIKKAKLVILATDEDREGEAIAWHLTQVLSLNPVVTRRIVFHEITKKAIETALLHPRPINLNLVDAQQARRILDRLVGYKLSPFLWKKVKRGLSAGRVQSPALRLICDREKEIKAFNSQEFWTIDAELKKRDEEKTFLARLIKKDGKIIPKLGIKSKKEAERMILDLENCQYKVYKIRKKEIIRTPPPPFITASLQQEAAKVLGFSAKQTMLYAQQLYEGIKIEKETCGLITYMRTDSYTLAKEALEEAKKVIQEKFGSKYSLKEPRIFRTKSKLAQEAHEAIRPTSLFRLPEDVKKYLDHNQYRLYNLIWKRTIVSQMQSAIFDSTSVDIKASKKETKNRFLFRARGLTVKFDGFLRIYLENEKNKKQLLKEEILPNLSKNEIIELIRLIPEQHFTQPPPRYTEASLIRTLEKEGIGRPSTYAPIISTIQKRDYIRLDEGKRFYPTEIGILVNDLLVKHFPNIVDLKFTAHMEDNLDKIANNQVKWVPVIREFYIPFEKNLRIKEKKVEKFEEKTKKKCPKCKTTLVIKFGRYGKFLACPRFPKCDFSKPLKTKEEKEIEKEAAKEKCEKCQSPLILKQGRFGPFLACSKYPKCDFTKPIIKKTGAKCPRCKKGEIIMKKTKKGRTFYACNKFPECKFALWQKPTGNNCPKCGSLLIFSKKGKILCMNKKCDYFSNQP